MPRLSDGSRFAPRDYLAVIDNDLLGVRAARTTVELGSHTIDAVWTPYFTPSRMPLPDQRWAGAASLVALPIVLRTLPGGSQAGVRWGHTTHGSEYSLSFFDGFNHLRRWRRFRRRGRGAGPAARLPAGVAMRFPSIRMYGADGAVPLPWLTMKGESAYFTSSSSLADEYVLYVVQVERQVHDGIVVAGYAGETVTERRALKIGNIRAVSGLA